jgi:hypothetical protein
MKGLTSLLMAAAVLGVAAAGCGSTSYGPGGKPAVSTAGETVGQALSQQPEEGGLKNPAYTAAHNSCSLYDLAELARQNGVKATPEAVAKVYSSGETTPEGKKQAYQGCLDALKIK